MFLADIQTTDGSQTANVRWKNKDAYGVKVKIAEEQSKDTEIDHITEIVGYMVFSNKCSEQLIVDKDFANL